MLKTSLENRPAPVFITCRNCGYSWYTRATVMITCPYCKHSLKASKLYRKNEECKGCGENERI